MKAPSPRTLVPLLVALAVSFASAADDWAGLHERARTLLAEQRYPDALEAARSAVAAARSAFDRDDARYAESLSTLGAAHARLDELDRADEAFLEALERHRDSLGSGHPRVGFALLDLAWLRGLEGRHAEAGPHLESALAIGERHSEDAEGRRLRIETLERLADHHEATGDSTRAREMAARAAELRQGS